MVDVANGLGQRNPRFENGEDARRYGGGGRDVLSPASAGRGHGGVLRLGGKRRAHVDENSGGGVGAALYADGANTRDARRLHLCRRRSRGSANSGGAGM